MSLIAESLILFVFLFILFYFKFPDITNNNYLFHKLILFVSTFVFKFVIELGKKIKDNEKVDAMEILKETIHFSLYNIIGYSIYIDLIYMKIPYENLYINLDSDNQRYIISSLIISCFVFLINLIKEYFTKK
jgi:hypothetical protein